MVTVVQVPFEEDVLATATALSNACNTVQAASGNLSFIYDQTRGIITVTGTGPAAADPDCVVQPFITDLLLKDPSAWAAAVAPYDAAGLVITNTFDAPGSAYQLYIFRPQAIIPGLSSSFVSVPDTNGTVSWAPALFVGPIAATDVDFDLDISPLLTSLGSPNYSSLFLGLRWTYLFAGTSPVAVKQHVNIFQDAGRTTIWKSFPFHLVTGTSLWQAVQRDAEHCFFPVTLGQTLYLRFPMIALAAGETLQAQLDVYIDGYML